MKEFKVMRKRRHRRVSKDARRRNRALAIISMVLCAVVLVGGVCALCFKYLALNEEVQHQAFEPCVIENEQTTTLIMKTGQTSMLTVPIEEDKLIELEFVSDNPDVLTVDSGGRVDAIKEGVATVTAYSRDFTGMCTVTVEKAQEAESKSKFTTAYIANLDIVKENKKDASQNLYSVTVNRRTNTVTVYTYDEKGDYVIPVRAMVCSCGEFTDENITPVGEYSVYMKNRWHGLFGDVYGQYITGFSGHYLFHSVPYLKTSENTLKSDEFNKLGTNASQGCVRLMVADAKWIYDNIDIYTSVEVIDKTSGSDPLGTPPAIKVDTDIKWDPTDPHRKNPYNEKAPQIVGPKDITIAKNTDYEPKVKALDTCSNDITDKMTVTGNVITSKAGQYLVTYSVTDDLGKTAETTITVTVKDEE